MKEANKKTLIGPVNGSFAFKICPDGTVDRNIVLCNFCNKEFSYHRSSSSLKYHLNAKHSGAKLEVMETLNGQQNASSEEENPQTTNQNILMFEPVEENQKTLFGPVNGSFGFKICPDGTVDKSTVLCNFCNKEFSYHRSSSSLKYHLNAKHSGAILEVRTLNETLDGQQNASSEDEKPQTTNQNVLTLEPVYHPDTQEQDQAIERALALWIGRTGLPLQTVEDKDFVSMMAVVDSRLKIPNKTKISNLIESIYEDERKKFKDRLATARKLTIGLGIWTTKGLGASFLSISACYFCPVQNQAQHILLSLEEISHPHAAHSIKVCLDRCTELWGIPENKILTIITSNGGKMAAAFRPEEEEPSSADSEDDERSDGEYEDEETRYGALTIERTPCFVHTLQVVVNMLYKEVSVTHLLEKVRAVVKQFCRSSNAMEKLGQPFGLTLIKDRVPRWSSTYQMMSHLIQGKDSVVQVANEMGWCCLLPDEWLKITALRDLLLPFAHHVKTLQSDTMSLSLIVPALLDLTSHLNQFSLESAHRDLRGLAHKMKVNLEQCFSCFLFPSETKFSPLAAAACLLDPTVSRDALIDNTDDGVQELLNEAEKFVLGASTTIKDEDESDKDYGDASWEDVKEEPLSKRPRFRFLSAKLASSKQPKPPMTKTLQELRKYKEELSSSQNISDFESGMDFWLAQNSMTYVTLKPLALDLLAMPASQAFAERAFSFTDDLTRSQCKRARMIWERNAFLKLNQDQ